MVTELKKEDVMRKVLLCMLLAFGMFYAGCSSKEVVQPTPQAVQPEIQAQPAVVAQEPAQKKPDIRPAERISEQQLAKIDTKDETPRNIEEKSMFDDIHFDYDKYEVRAEAQAVLQTIASWLLKNPSAKILVEGHCDERGTNEYNLALADRRAKSVRDYLIALGTAAGKIEMVSYGEEKPLCTEHTEECWSKNRRAHFVILREAGK
jgi:peptidoglycan-associated lipoprotein